MTGNKMTDVETLEALRALTPQDFLVFGVEHVAYLRPVTVNGRAAYAIHAADGTPMSVMESLHLAQVAVRQNDLEPLTLH